MTTSIRIRQKTFCKNLFGFNLRLTRLNRNDVNILHTWSGLDIGYVPAGPNAFFRSSGQFGPQQFILYWSEGPVAFRFFFFFFFFFSSCTGSLAPSAANHMVGKGTYFLMEVNANVFDCHVQSAHKGRSHAIC